MAGTIWPAVMVHSRAAIDSPVLDWKNHIFVIVSIIDERLEKSIFLLEKVNESIASLEKVSSNFSIMITRYMISCPELYWKNSKHSQNTE